MDPARPWIILDRDGVINRDSDAYVKSPEEWEPIPGSLQAIARLKRAGWAVVVATNQSGLARGLFTEADLEAMHAKFRRLLAEQGGEVDAIHWCPHGPEDACDCRKPLPGLYRRAAAALGRELAGVPVIGDSLRDLQAARAVGARPILVRTGKGERTLVRGEGLEDVEVHADLAAAVDALLAESPA